jgi:nucleoside-diphosphate-sugar epimerase
VVRAAVAAGHQVVAVGRGAAAARGDVEWRQLDLLSADAQALADLAASSRATHCIHAAWYTNHADYLVHEVNRAWVAASLRLADACSGLRLTALGTGLEYDSSAGTPDVEDQTPLRPETLYAQSKRDLFEALATRGGDVVWARVFFVYGPGDRAGRLVPAMLAGFAAGEASGPRFGGLRRDYIHVDDLAGQILGVALSDATGAVNTGSGQAPSLSEMFEAGARAFGRPELALANDETGGQPLLIQPDMARFRERIGALNARSLAEGLSGLVRSPA